MSITFTKEGEPSIVLDALYGSINSERSGEKNGSGVIPYTRKGAGISGSCRVLLDDTSFTISDALSLKSGTGPGSTTVSGDAECSYALIDVEISGSAVQTALISWKGL